MLPPHVLIQFHSIVQQHFLNFVFQYCICNRLTDRQTPRHRQQRQQQQQQCPCPGLLLNASHFSRSKPPAVSLSIHTISHTHTHTLHSPLHSLSLLRSHSVSVSHRKPATTDASHKPLTPNPTHAPIFGAKNEADKLEMASDDCSIRGQLESQRSVSECWLTGQVRLEQLVQNKALSRVFLFHPFRRPKLVVIKLPSGTTVSGACTCCSCKSCC